MKKKLSIFLCIMIICCAFYACEKKSQIHTYPKDEADNEEVSVSTEIRSIVRGEMTLIVETDNIVIENDDKITNDLFSLRIKWLSDAITAAEATVNDFRREYFEGNPKTFRISTKITYNKGGLISELCTLSYSYYGNDVYFFIGAETVRLEDGYKPVLRDVITCDSALTENLLTVGITPLLNDSYPDEIQSAGGHFSEICDFYINGEGLNVFVCYPYLAHERCDLITLIPYYGNEELFAFEIFE